MMEILSTVGRKSVDPDRLNGSGSTDLFMVLIDVGDGCDSNCDIEPGWNCTQVVNKTSNCSQVCGNGIITFSEQCDDGNTKSGDGCNGTCQIEPGWNCSGSPSVCQKCGNDIIEGTESTRTRNQSNASSM